jgi:hypothetical protein
VRFLRAMLYGIKTRRSGTPERDWPKKIAGSRGRGGAMEGKWSLSGRRELILRRFSRGGVPFGAFSAIDARDRTGTPGPFGRRPGEALLGVSRGGIRAFGLIGQGRLPFNGEQELEKRIAALVYSGEETVSYSQASSGSGSGSAAENTTGPDLSPVWRGACRGWTGCWSGPNGAASRQEYARQELERLKREEGRLEDERRLPRLVCAQRAGRAPGPGVRGAGRRAGRKGCAREKWAEISRKSAASDLFSGMTHDEAWTKAVKDAAEARPDGGDIPVIDAVCLGALAGGVAGVLAALLAPVCAGPPQRASGRGFRVFTNKTKAKSRADTRAACWPVTARAVPRKFGGGPRTGTGRPVCAPRRSKRRPDFAWSRSRPRRTGGAAAVQTRLSRAAPVRSGSRHIEKTKNTPEETEERPGRCQGRDFSRERRLCHGGRRTQHHGHSPAALMARREEGKEGACPAHTGSTRRSHWRWSSWPKPTASFRRGFPLRSTPGRDSSLAA